MSNTHAGPPAPLLPGFCAWRWHFEDVDMHCDAPVLLTTPLCADHYIDWAHERARRGIPAVA